MYCTGTVDGADSEMMRELSAFRLTTCALKSSIMGVISTSFSLAEEAGQPRLVCVSTATLECPTGGN